MSTKREMLAGAMANVDESIGVRADAAPPTFTPRAQPAKDVGVTRSRNTVEIEVARIVPDPDQPRKDFEPDALARLAESLRSKGQLQPIQVRWSEDAQRYVVLLGERRWRAAQTAGLSKLMCVVREAPLTDQERLSIQVIENCLREDLTPMEQARAFRALMDREAWTMERVAEELAVSRSQVVKALSLLRLPAAVQEQVEQGGLASSAAYELAKLDDPAEQVRMATAAVDQGLTRDDLARQVKAAAPRRKAATTARPAGRRVQPVRVLRMAGYKLTLERKAGVDPESALVALREAIRCFEAEAAPGEVAA